MPLVKVEGRPDLIKDTVTGAILNVDRSKSDEYFVKKNQINKTREIEENVREMQSKLLEIDNLKNDLLEIKSLLKEIINK